MQLWQRQVIQLQRTPAVLGQTLNFQAQQDSFISEFLISLEGVIGTAAATANPEGLAALVQNVRVTGSLNAGGNINPINNVRGPQLFELAQFIRANVSYSFGSLGSTGSFGVYIPCTFENPRMGYPNQFMSVLPSNAMGQLSVSVTIANQNQVDTNSPATFALTSMNVSVQQNQFFVNTLPATTGQNAWQYFSTTVDVLTNNNVQSGIVQQQFPNGAAFLNILMRSMSATSASVRACVTKQADGAATGPIDTTSTSAGFTLLDSNNVPKRQMDWYQIRKDNLDHITDSLVAGNACFQFNRGIMDVWRPTPGPSIIPLNVPYTTTGTTNPLVEFVYQRLFDPANALNLA